MKKKIFINNAPTKINRKVKLNDIILYNFDIENDLEDSTDQKKLNWILFMKINFY